MRNFPRHNDLVEQIAYQWVIPVWKSFPECSGAQSQTARVKEPVKNDVNDPRPVPILATWIESWDESRWKPVFLQE